ncbi:MAG: zinc-ribbon domain-containing protein [Elusimicrobiota bacterium]
MFSIIKYFFPIVFLILFFGKLFAKPEPPVLLSPENGEIITTTLPTFEWYGVEDTACYNIAIYSDRECTKKIVDASSNYPQKEEWTVPDRNYLQKGKTYYWRVATLNSDGWSKPSSVWSFIIEWSALTKEVPSSNINNERKSQSDITDEKICPSCNRRNRSNANFCRYCGRSLTNVIIKDNDENKTKIEYKESYQPRPEPKPVREEYTPKQKTIKDITWVEGGILVLAVLLCL